MHKKVEENKMDTQWCFMESRQKCQSEHSSIVVVIISSIKSSKVILIIISGFFL